VDAARAAHAPEFIAWSQVHAFCLAQAANAGATAPTLHELLHIPCSCLLTALLQQQQQQHPLEIQRMASACLRRSRVFFLHGRFLSCMLSGQDMRPKIKKSYQLMLMN